MSKLLFVLYLVYFIYNTGFKGVVIVHWNMLYILHYILEVPDRKNRMKNIMQYHEIEAYGN